MFIVGVYDDFYNADFKLKFLLQIIVAKIIIDQGYVISNYHGLFGLYEVPWLLAQLSTVFVFLSDYQCHKLYRRYRWARHNRSNKNNNLTDRVF